MSDDNIPLSVNQEAMWVGWRIDPAATTHVLPIAFAVTGDLALPRLRGAVTALGARHPILRGRVVARASGGEDDGQVRDPARPCLAWDGAPPIPVTEHAVTGSREQAVLAATRTPFDLDHGPLARFEVLRGPEYTILLFAVHHIVFDGASLVPLLVDLQRAYAGDDLDAPDDPAPVAELASRTRDLADGPEGDGLRGFWRDQLSGSIGRQDLTEASHLPHLPGGEADSAFGLWTCAVDRELEAQVRELAREVRATYFTVMFGALFLVLRHHSGGEDPIVSAPYHGRKAPALAGRVGYFVNVLPFRPRPSGAETYRDYLSRFRAQARDVLAHHALPLPALLRAASLTGPQAHELTHHTVFQYWNSTLDARVNVRDVELSAPDGTCRLEMIDVLDVADYTLTAMLREDHEGSTMVWKDPNGRFGDDLLRRLAEDYLTVLRDMVGQPDRTVADGATRLSPSLALTRPVSSAVPDVTPSTSASPAPAPAADPDLVRAIGTVWADVLGLPTVSAGDSFFELGGHSLLATTLLERINRQLGTDLVLADLFGHPRLGELAAVVERRAADLVQERAEPDRATGPVPASLFQQGIWLAERMDPEHARYHIPLSWELTGLIDPELLRTALADLVARHELLRSGFVDRDGVPHLEVTAPWTPDVAQIDLPDADGAEFEDAVAAWGEAAARTFSVTQGRLLRAALHTGAGGRRTFSLCIHHLVLDGGSVPVLLRELRRCYRAAAEAVPLPARRRQYRDLVASWARQPCDTEFWQGRLNGAPSALGLRAPREPAPPGRFDLALPEDLTARLAPIRAEHQATDFMLMACAVAVALHRQTASEDVTFGFPVTRGRPPLFRDVIGPSMNTVLLRTRITSDMMISDLLRQVREEIVAVMAHQDVPFETVVRQQRPPRVPGRTPFLDVLLNSVDQSGWSIDLGEARLTPLAIGDRIDTDSKVPVTITMVTSESRVRASLAYQGDAVDRAAAADLAFGVADLLSGLPELIDRPVLTATRKQVPA